MKQQPKRKKPEEIVRILADKYKVTERYVQQIISGERNHDQILEEYMVYKERHNRLLTSVKKIVPFH